MSETPPSDRLADRLADRLVLEFERPIQELERKISLLSSTGPLFKKIMMSKKRAGGQERTFQKFGPLAKSMPLAGRHFLTNLVTTSPWTQICLTKNRRELIEEIWFLKLK